MVILLSVITSIIQAVSLPPACLSVDEGFYSLYKSSAVLSRLGCHRAPFFFNEKYQYIFIYYFIIINVSILCQRSESDLTNSEFWHIHEISILFIALNRISSNAFLYNYFNIATSELFRSSLSVDFTKDSESKINIKFPIGNVSLQMG